MATAPGRRGHCRPLRSAHDCAADGQCRCRRGRPRCGGRLLPRARPRTGGGGGDRGPVRGPHRGARRRPRRHRDDADPGRPQPLGADQVPPPGAPRRRPARAEHARAAPRDVRRGRHRRTIARLRPHGAELLGEVARYEDSYRLCNLRGPAGIIVALAERIG
ncbi:lactoylglutathione lyase [Streptomyces sp. SPB074]|nr:lactoylglutathione lyase [Streptomyces sp. SPB074]